MKRKFDSLNPLMTTHLPSIPFVKLPLAVVLTAILLVGFLFSPARAADPYDSNLQKRIEGLERELDALTDDSKGKNVEAGEGVPTFLKAAGKNVRELTISGDLRFRYNFDNEDFQYPTAGNALQRSRYLFRLRLNLNYTLTDHWFAAVGVTTNGAADSGNQTFTEGFDDYGIYLHQFMLGWTVSDYATVFMGKVFAPFYNNSDGLLNWSNITPTGLTETLTINPTANLNIRANLGQYLFYDNPESGFASKTNALGNNVNTTTYSVNPAGAVPESRQEDAWLFYQDLVVTYKPSNLITLILSPAFYFYAQHGSVGLSGNAVGSAGRANPNDVNTANPLVPNQGALLGTAQFNNDDATRNLYVGMFDGEIQFPVGPVKGKFYWDFAYNFEGGARDTEVLGLAEHGFQDKSSWIAGVQIGEPKRKGDWYASADYRQLGVGSTDPNLNDTNFALSRLNTQGIRAAVGYNVYDWLRAEAWYFAAWNLEKNLHDTAGNRLTSSNIRSFYDENAGQFFLMQLTAGF